jgi:hypothetical protein
MQGSTYPLPKGYPTSGVPDCQRICKKESGSGKPLLVNNKVSLFLICCSEDYGILSNDVCQCSMFQVRSICPSKTRGMTCKACSISPADAGWKQIYLCKLTRCVFDEIE